MQKQNREREREERLWWSPCRRMNQSVIESSPSTIKSSIIVVESSSGSIESSVAAIKSEQRCEEEATEAHLWPIHGEVETRNRGRRPPRQAHGASYAPLCIGPSICLVGGAADDHIYKRTPATMSPR